MDEGKPNIAVLGASGLIGNCLAEGLARSGFSVAAIARQFSDVQRHQFGGKAVQADFVRYTVDQLASLFRDLEADVVVNCVGVLQDGPHGRVREAHETFVRKLIAAIEANNRKILVIHLSIPGDAAGDETEFSRTKRKAEDLFFESPLPFVLLRPGFVIAPAAFGGSALIRSLAALPFKLPASASGRPFASVAISDIVETVAICANRWSAGQSGWRVSWDLMEQEPYTVTRVVEAFRQRVRRSEDATHIAGMAARNWR